MVEVGNHLAAAVAIDQLGAVTTVEGATDAEVFRAYGSRVLVPTLRRGDVVVMDNLSPRCARRAAAPLSEISPLARADSD